MTGRAWEVVRACRGPVLLVVFGVLMALNHSSRLTFDRSWPVLIIVYGLFKLAERMFPRPAAPVWPAQAYTPGPATPAPAPAPAHVPDAGPEYPHYPVQNPPGGLAK